MDRRELIKAVALIALAADARRLAAAETRAAKKPDSPAQTLQEQNYATSPSALPDEVAQTFVLVHGAWHGAWAWNEVKKLLEAAGHRVFVPTLTGVGERVKEGGSNVDVATHADDIGRLLGDKKLDDVVLVAHSYAGLPASLAADRDPQRIRQLIFLDALVPEPGRSAAAGIPADRLKEIEKMLIDGYRLPPPAPAELGIPDYDEELTATVKTQLTTMPWKTLSQPMPALGPGYNEVEKVFIHCEYNRLPGPLKGTELARAAGWPIFPLRTGHDAMLTEPMGTAALLRFIAKPAAPQRAASVAKTS